MAGKSYQMNYLGILNSRSSFSRYELLETMKRCGLEIGEAVFKVTLQKLLKNGQIVRVGRNAYCVAGEDLKIYEYQYSDLACNVAACIKEKYPYLDFTVLEMIQLNEFVNHQLAHNVVFVSVEDDIGDFVFDTLREEYPGKVFIDLNPEMYHKYWCDDMIVIEKLISEAPMGQKEKWHTRLEKLLVDLMSDHLLLSSVSEGAYPAIYEDAFRKYAVDESCMFRYAKRRGADKKIMTFIQDKTSVTLRTKQKNKHLQNC